VPVYYYDDTKTFGKAYFTIINRAFEIFKKGKPVDQLSGKLGRVELFNFIKDNM
jgi:hypothetical protein